MQELTNFHLERVGLTASRVRFLNIKPISPSAGADELDYDLIFALKTTQYGKELSSVRHSMN